MAYLVGMANETKILVNDVECLGLVDSEIQLSTINIEFVKQLWLEIHQLDRILKIAAMGGYSLHQIHRG